MDLKRAEMTITTQHSVSPPVQQPNPWPVAQEGCYCWPFS